MADEARLRAVPSAPEEGADVAAPSAAGRGGLAGAGPWITLAALLTLAVAVLGWGRLQMGERLRALEGQVDTLQADVAARDRVLRAQQGRLEDVREHVERLNTLLDAPLPSVE